ncbi:MAG: hypothetical protein JO149_00130, partial [Gammaproteobacteria bacterium]|nr:hypothetical protein [Gammaproteobacteria bacterium]
KSGSQSIAIVDNLPPELVEKMVFYCCYKGYPYVNKTGITIKVHREKDKKKIAELGKEVVKNYAKIFPIAEEKAEMAAVGKEKQATDKAGTRPDATVPEHMHHTHLKNV